MKQGRNWKVIISIFIVIITLGSVGYINSNIYRKKVIRKKIYEASGKTIQYYYDTYKPQKFAGILDWPALGLYGFGQDVSGETWTVHGKNAPYWREQQVKRGYGISKTKNTDYQRTIIGITSANKDPRNFGGVNLVKAVKETMLPNGHFADSVEDKRTKKPIGDDLINAQCFGVISLHCAGEPVPNRDKAIRWLEKNQHRDGGYTWDVKDYDDKEDYMKVVSDVDMTAAVLMAFSILGADKDYPPVRRALDFLEKQQLDNGGFESWGVQNPESTVWAMQACLMYGESPLDKKWSKGKRKTPIEFVLKHQLENGAFTHVLDENDMLPVYDNSMTTYQCLYGMADAYNDKTTYNKLFEANKEKTKKILYMDLKKEDYGYKEAIEMSYNYIMDIYNDGKFKPNKKITKGNLARYLVNILNLQNDFYEKYSGDELKFAKLDKKPDVLKIDDDNNYIELCIEKELFEDISTLNKKGNKNREVEGKEFMMALKNGGKFRNKTPKGESIEFNNFNEKETVSRINCAVSLSKLKQLIK